MVNIRPLTSKQFEADFRFQASAYSDALRLRCDRYV